MRNLRQAYASFSTIDRARIGFELVQREAKAVLDCLRIIPPGRNGRIGSAAPENRRQSGDV
jgi:hypothetical protein